MHTEDEEYECEFCHGVFGSNLERMLHKRMIHQVEVTQQIMHQAELDYEQAQAGATQTNAAAAETDVTSESVEEPANLALPRLGAVVPPVSSSDPPMPAWMVNADAHPTTHAERRRAELLEQEVIIRKSQIELQENREVLREFAQLAAAHNDMMEDQVYMLEDIKVAVNKSVQEVANDIVKTTAVTISEVMAETTAKAAAALQLKDEQCHAQLEAQEKERAEQIVDNDKKVEQAAGAGVAGIAEAREKAIAEINRAKTEAVAELGEMFSRIEFMMQVLLDRLPSKNYGVAPEACDMESTTDAPFEVSTNASLVQK
ncbi:hypothetical protein, variant [Sphaeroforma arctica JP610]|uniref:C2H2-type domain-containing protein n=1 Tax=Sphaeroforma arctica JP610 TaxID=667725 RepID=A0A0L0GBV6_9EUKA|nr:hypothetical protein, variant [Sphaeroforma arctica JP610]KNC86376.1 hypothetical protein, variant [Sphaeroforma arctica JP610]|eukprot:XP_014160279.1 hypothetical protein, variant [Sphaeroforma arctica JP610]